MKRLILNIIAITLMAVPVITIMAYGLFGIALAPDLASMSVGRLVCLVSSYVIMLYTGLVLRMEVLNKRFSVWGENEIR